MTRYPGTDSLIFHPKDTKVTLLLKFAECAPKRKILLPVGPEPGISRSAVCHLATKQPTMYIDNSHCSTPHVASGICRRGMFAGPQEVSLGKLFSTIHQLFYSFIPKIPAHFLQNQAIILKA